MKSRISKVVLHTACIVLIGVVCVPGMAQTPDFEGILEGLQEKLDAAAGNAWTASVWTFVEPNPPDSALWRQQAPGFVGHDHTGNGIAEDDHLALLQRVLENDPAVVRVLGQPLVNRIRSGFAVNLTNVMRREAWFDLEIKDTSRMNLRYTILFIPVNIRNRPAYIERTRVLTGSTNSITICVDTGVSGIDVYCEESEVEMPSLWGDGGTLNTRVEGLGDDIAHLMAAYLTLGRQAHVDYLQALLYQFVCRGLLEFDFDLKMDLGNKRATDAIVETGGVRPSVDKAYTMPLLPDIVYDEVFDPPDRHCFNDRCSSYVEFSRMELWIYGDSLQAGVGEFWLNTYTVGANGFGMGFESVLGASGDFNGDGISNVDSYDSVSGDRHGWLLAMDIVRLPEDILVEGEPEVDEATQTGGCFAGCGAKSGKQEALHRFLGDWLLLGLGVVLLTALQGVGKL